MRLHVLSDLHAEIDPRRARSRIVDLGADVVVLAGDIDQGGDGVRWAAAIWPATPVVYVLGNHESYGSSIEETLGRCRAAARGSQIHVLEQDAVTLGGARFLGATLWTDLQLSADSSATHQILSRELSDYRAIVDSAGGRLQPSATEERHRATRAWLAGELKRPHDGPTIVVTHHAPSPRSLSGGRGATAEADWSPIQAAYASDLDAFTEWSGAAIWIHGHTHRSCSYHIGGTLVVANPRGYYGEATGWDPAYVIETHP